jgi:signal transduction histidine kinase
MVVVTVEDTGPGIPDGMKETLFQRFSRIENQGCGEGLGLSIVGMLVERYGGRVWVEDRVSGRPDLGAAFRFTLREVARTPTGDGDPE